MGPQPIAHPYWQLVSEAVRLRVMEGTCTHVYGRVRDMLAVSYEDLPYDLKLCFLYLSVFPEDCRIPAGMLIRMWIAEGLVTANEEMCVEDVAMQRLEELRHRFMIQVVSTNFRGAIKAIHMHDLLHDLCVRKAKEQKFLEIYTHTNLCVTYDEVSVQSRKIALHTSTDLPVHISKLRSLVVLTRSTVMHSAYVSKESLELGIVCDNFKLLRLLNLWGIKARTGALPAQIGSLIHLRYLGIRASNITELPKSLGNLRNLLTLDYRNIESDVDVIIPNILWKLKLLRHLYLPTECPWHAENLELSPLKNLQILWGLNCTVGDWFSQEMLDLSTTLKKLKVVVSSKKDLEAAFKCQSLMYDGLHTFHCEWENGIALHEMYHCFHNQHLHKLVLVGTIRVKKLILPSNLLVLELKDSVLMDEDPMIIAGALPHLKFLKLTNSYEGTAFTSSLGSFRQLEELYLENLQNLKTWSIENGAMPTLRKLDILSCPKLHFPQGLVDITSLQQVELVLVSHEFAEQAKVYGWSQDKRRVPHNFEAIMKQCDNSLNVSSIHKLYEQLTAGVFLDNKKKKFWVLKQEDHHYNCFMLYGTNLLTKTYDRDFFPRWIAPTQKRTNSRLIDHPHIILWNLIDIEGSDGALIKAAKLISDEGRFKVCGSFDINNLSPGVTYTFSFVIMLDESNWVEELSIKTKLVLPDHESQMKTLMWTEIPRNKWFDVYVGELEIHRSGTNGLAEFFLACQWSSVSNFEILIGGVIKPNI